MGRGATLTAGGGVGVATGHSLGTAWALAVTSCDAGLGHEAGGALSHPAGMGQLVSGAAHANRLPDVGLRVIVAVDKAPDVAEQLGHPLELRSCELWQGLDGLALTAGVGALAIELEPHSVRAAPRIIAPGALLTFVGEAGARPRPGPREAHGAQGASGPSAVELLACEGAWAREGGVYVYLGLWGEEKAAHDTARIKARAGHQPRAATTPAGHGTPTRSSSSNWATFTRKEPSSM